MNWTALVVVTGLSTLFMIIQYVANQRQYDFSLDSPRVQPVNQPSSVNQQSPVAAAAALDDQPAAASHSDGHRGIGFSFDARSDDDCSSYLLSKPRPHAAATFSDPRNNDNGNLCADHRNAGTDCTGRRQPTASTQPSVTNYNPLGGARYRNSEQSISCGDGAQNWDDVRQRARSSGSSPHRNSDESVDSHSSFEHREAQSPVTGTDVRNPIEIRRGSSDTIEIITSCDRNTAFTPEVAACEDNDDSERRRGSRRRTRQRFCEQTWVAMSRSVDYIVIILNVLLILLLIINWFFRTYGEADDEANGGRSGNGSSTNTCTTWRSFLYIMGFGHTECEPAFTDCQKN